MADHQHSGRDPHDKVSEKLHDGSTSSWSSSDDEKPLVSDHQPIERACLGGTKGKGFPIKKAVRFGLRSRRIRDTDMADKQHSDHQPIERACLGGTKGKGFPIKKAVRFGLRSRRIRDTKMADEQHSDESLTTSFSSDDENYYGSENQRSSSSSSDDENPRGSENQRSSSSSSDDENSPVACHQHINPFNRPVGDADWCRWKRPASILGGVTLCVLLFHFAIWIISFAILKLVHLLAILFIWIISFAIVKLVQLLAIWFIFINSFAMLERCFIYAPRTEAREVAAVHIFPSVFSRAFAGLHEAVTGTDKKKSILVVAVICVVAVIGSCCSYLLAGGHSCRWLLTNFSFMMISHLRHGAVNIMASEFCEAFADLREAVTGTDKKKIVLVVAVIWVTAFIGSCSSFPLTIFSFMIISSVVILERSLRQKIAICGDVRHNLLSDHYTELRRGGFNDDDALLYAHLYGLGTIDLNYFADQCWAAYFTYRKTSILVVASLWLLFVIGSWRDFLTIALMLVVTHTVQFLYGKYQD